MDDDAGRKKDEEEEVILALQRERKNQYVSFKKFGEFRARNGNIIAGNKKGGKVTALGCARVLISLLVFGLYWFVDAMDGSCACLLFVASCFVVSVHPAVNSHAKMKG